MSEKENLIGKKVLLYIPENKKHEETEITEVLYLKEDKKTLVRLKSGALVSLDIVKFKEEGSVEEHGKTEKESN